MRSWIRENSWLYCDLDHLKYINDNFGHLEGDEYLKFFVRVVKENIREEDIFARIGGDEFCILLRSCAREDAQNRMADIQREFSERNKTVYERSFSCGIIEIPENHSPVKLEKLIHEADENMYGQKREHKNSIKIK